MVTNLKYSIVVVSYICLSIYSFNFRNMEDGSCGVGTQSPERGKEGCILTGACFSEEPQGGWFCE